MNQLVDAQQYARRMAKHILRQCPEAVDDVLQTGALNAIRFQDRFNGKSQFKTWFTRIVINEALLHLRRAARRTFVGLAGTVESEEGRMLRWEVPSPDASPEVLASGLE